MPFIRGGTWAPMLPAPSDLATDGETMLAWRADTRAEKLRKLRAK